MQSNIVKERQPLQMDMFSIKEHPQIEETDFTQIQDAIGYLQSMLQSSAQLTQSSQKSAKDPSYQQYLSKQISNQFLSQNSKNQSNSNFPPQSQEQHTQSSLQNLDNMSSTQQQSLSDYITMLNDKYYNIVEILKEEETKLNHYQQESINLKSRLANEILAHEQTVNEAQTQIAQLQERNKSVLNKRSDNQMQLSFKEIELKQINKQIAALEEDIKRGMHESVIEQENLNEGEQFLQQQQKLLLDSEQEAERSRQMVEQAQITLQQMQNELQEQKLELERLVKTARTVEAKMETVWLENADFSQSEQQLQASQAKVARVGSGLQKKQEEVYKLEEGLVKELAVKTKQLEVMRLKNDEIKQQINGFKSCQAELKTELKLQEALRLENNVLMHHIQVSTDQLYQHSKMSADNNINDTSQYLNQIQNNKQHSKSNMNLPGNTNVNGNKIVVNASLDNVYTLQQENQKQNDMIHQIQESMKHKEELMQSQKAALEEMRRTIKELEGSITSSKQNKEMLSARYDNLQGEMNVMNQKYLSVLRQFNHQGGSQVQQGQQVQQIQQAQQERTPQKHEVQPFSSLKKRPQNQTKQIQVINNEDDDVDQIKQHEYSVQQELLQQKEEVGHLLTVPRMAVQQVSPAKLQNSNEHYQHQQFIAQPQQNQYDQNLESTDNDDELLNKQPIKLDLSLFKKHY